MDLQAKRGKTEEDDPPNIPKWIHDRPVGSGSHAGIISELSVSSWPDLRDRNLSIVGKWNELTGGLTVSSGRLSGQLAFSLSPFMRTRVLQITGSKFLPSNTHPRIHHVNSGWTDAAILRPQIPFCDTNLRPAGLEPLPLIPSERDHAF